MHFQTLNTHAHIYMTQTLSYTCKQINEHLKHQLLDSVSINDPSYSYGVFCLEMQLNNYHSSKVLFPSNHLILTGIVARVAR